MALPTTYTVSLPLKTFADSIIMAQALSGFLCLQELKSSYTAMTTANKNYFKTSPWQSKPLQFLLSQTSSIFLFLSLVFQDHKRDEFLASCCWSRQLLTFPPSAATLGVRCDTALGWRKQGQQPGWQHWRSLPCRHNSRQVTCRYFSTLSAHPIQLPSSW